MNYTFLFHILRFQSSKYACIACAAVRIFSHCFVSSMYVLRYVYGVYAIPYLSPLLYRPQAILLSPDGEKSNATWWMLGIIASIAVYQEDVFSSA